MRSSIHYQNNPNLPNEQYRHSFTQEELNEYVRCSEDPVYFALKYIKIVSLDHGLVPFKLWDFQKDMINSFHQNRFTICKLPRQVGKTTSSVAFLLHYVLFNENAMIAILANRAPTAREILHRLKLSFEYLPMFLKQGIKEWNKGSIHLANGSRVLADSTSGSSVRGLSFNIIFLDEFAHVPNNIAEEFFASTYPTISSGKNTKVIIVSTPKGLNLFWRLWTESTEGRSEYKPIEIHWSMVPGRDEAWKEQTIRNTSLTQFEQEFECLFHGSTNTLISGPKLQALAIKAPVYSEILGGVQNKNGTYDVYQQPIPKHTYVICVDVAEGQNLDYSAFSIFDVTSIPYMQVAKYRNNNITPAMLPAVVYTAAKKYNDAFVLVEINSIGLQVSDILHYEMAYENLLKFQMKGKQGNQPSDGFAAGGRNKIAFGLRTTTQSKMIGCSNLKALIESDKLVIHDADTIMELSTFSTKGRSFAAEEGNNDDLAMTLVHFGWLASQKYFKENISEDIKNILRQEQMEVMDANIVPFGFIDNGLNKPDETHVDKDGDRWFSDREQLYPFDDLNFQWDSRL